MESMNGEASYHCRWFRKQTNSCIHSDELMRCELVFLSKIVLNMSIK